MTLTEIAAGTTVAENHQDLGDGLPGPGASDDDGPGGGPGPVRARIEAVPADVVDRLMAQVRRGDLELLGEGGVIAELAKKLLERALDQELTDHIGYDRGDPAGRGSGNSRNGTTPKRVLTELGAVDLDIPRDRNATSSIACSASSP
jgi:putative transposase